MHHQLPSPSTHQQVSVLQSRDLVAGLGAAPRHLLATCLALFEDGTLQLMLYRLLLLHLQFYLV